MSFKLAAGPNGSEDGRETADHKSRISDRASWMGNREGSAATVNSSSGYSDGVPAGANFVGVLSGALAGWYREWLLLWRYWQSAQVGRSYLNWYARYFMIICLYMICICIMSVYLFTSQHTGLLCKPDITDMLFCCYSLMFTRWVRFLF